MSHATHQQYDPRMAQGQQPGPNGQPQITFVGLAEKRKPDLRVRAPHHDQHVFTEAQVPVVALPVCDDGVIVGVDPSRQPAVLSLFRRRPVEVALVGGTYLTQLLIVRAAGVGARVVIETARPSTWANVAQNTGGGQQCVVVAPVGRIGQLGPSMQSPVLVVRDAGARPPRSRVPKSPWQSTLTLLPYLDPRAVGLLATADLAALQRVSPQEAHLAARTLRLPLEDAQALPSLADELTLWCAKTDRRYVFTAPTNMEVNMLGNPRRTD
jgi:hypothetical protein